MNKLPTCILDIIYTDKRQMEFNDVISEFIDSVNITHIHSQFGGCRDDIDIFTGFWDLSIGRKSCRIVTYEYVFCVDCGIVDWTPICDNCAHIRDELGD